MPGGSGQCRVFVVEDELMIQMLLEDMLSELGYSVAAVAGRIEEAISLARDADFDLAILDVNLDGQPVYPIAEILAGRGLPFVFSTGQESSELEARFRDRPILQKPFEIDGLGRTLAGLAMAPRVP